MEETAKVHGKEAVAPTIAVVAGRDDPRLLRNSNTAPIHTKVWSDQSQVRLGTGVYPVTVVEAFGKQRYIRWAIEVEKTNG